MSGTGYDRRYSTIRRYGAKSSPVRLIPEPGNAFDRFAIGVHLQWKTEKGTEHWDQIGYVPIEFSEIVSGFLSCGEWAIEAAFIRTLDASPELDAPRVWVRLEGKDLRKGK